MIKPVALVTGFFVSTVFNYMPGIIQPLVDAYEAYRNNMTENYDKGWCKSVYDFPYYPYTLNEFWGRIKTDDEMALRFNLSKKAS